MIIVSGPSTVGKNPFINQACIDYNLSFVVPITTRERRLEEINNIDYSFISKDEFKKMIISGLISQWDYCLDNYYGYSFVFPGNGNQITHGLSRMTLRIKSQFPDRITTVFLMPYSEKRVYETLESIYSGSMLCLRKALVKEEICHSSLFDYVFTVNETAINLLKNDLIQELLEKEKLME